MVAAVLHGVWDFGIISSQVVANKTYLGTGLFILADVVLALIVLIRRRSHRAEPAVND